ncbi:MAG: family 43 glycosylhydrolase [candidate division KSB1 bacterium]|nr:family 43 glycosylhydrolase [candidate division KSB1 bacterium]
MKKGFSSFYSALVTVLSAASLLLGQNPIIRDQFTADPTARVFNGKVYLYPSHDILAQEGKGRVGWFCMEDYHVFSSPDLVDWTDHGVIVSQDKVNWVDANSYSMWAPDCVERNGKYYFYFPATRKSEFGRGFGIGVAVADSPAGPFVPQPEPLKGVFGIDPNVLIDKDGQAYLYWSAGNIFVAKLTDDMLHLASEPQVVADLPQKGLKEGPFVFERNGIYYMTYPHVENKTERLEYAMGDNPMGPFRVTGVIMDESPTGCWTNHHSIVEFNGQWYLFYHHNDYSPHFDKCRSARIDSLFFNEDGTIRKVIPTLRGVGITKAANEIQIDRYSSKSDGVSIAFLDTLNTFAGWKTCFGKADEWVQYNSVEFNKKYRRVQVKANAPKGGRLAVYLHPHADRPVAEVKIPAGPEWQLVEARLKKQVPGTYHLVVRSRTTEPIEVDWIRFQ